jgi:hypothetical protein
MWPKVRRANIPSKLRERFKFYGEPLMIVAIESGDGTRIGTELAKLGQEHREEIVSWLQECRDLEARREALRFWSMLVLTLIAAIAASIAAWPIIRG